jgi:mono/diheme cytochrome c family protein
MREAGTVAGGALAGEAAGGHDPAMANRGGRSIYNTTLPGYGNYGHKFGDQLTDAQRKAVIEYLKTL